MLLPVFYFPATSKVISEKVPICDSVFCCRRMVLEHLSGHFLQVVMISLMLLIVLGGFSYVIFFFFIFFEIINNAIAAYFPKLN